MDNDIPWIYVAMIFIAFVSWIRSRLQEAAELRRAKVIRKKTTRKAPESTARTLPSSPYLHGPSSATRPKPLVPEPAVVESHEPELPKTFRELFEVLQEQVVGQAEPQATRQSAPPPLPAATPSRIDPAATEQSRNRSVPVQEEALPVSSGSYHARKVARKTSGDLSRILKTRGTLREALIMKEILDTPIALRD